MQWIRKKRLIDGAKVSDHGLQYLLELRARRVFYAHIYMELQIEKYDHRSHPRKCDFKWTIPLSKDEINLSA